MSKFKTANNEKILDQAERDSILHSNERNILVDASAGSGKTHLLVEKAFWYVHNDYIKTFEKIAMITFTQLATRQLRETEDKLLEKYSSEKNYINSEYTHRFQIMTNHGFVLEEIIRPFLRDAYGREYPKEDEWYQEFSRIYKIDSYTEGLEQLKDKKVLGSYRDNKKNFNYELALEILNKSINARQYIRAKYPIIMIDEYQDVDPDMHQLFMYLKESLKIRLFIVGDVKQAIYGFRGADRKIFHRLENKEFNKYELVHNFRSDLSIVHFSREFVPGIDKFKDEYDYKISSVNFVDNRYFYKDIIEHSDLLKSSSEENIVYLYGNRGNIRDSEISTLKQKGFAFVEDTPLNSGHPNYNVLEPLLRLFHDNTMDIYELLDILGVEFLISNIRVAKKIHKKIEKGNTEEIRKGLNLFSELVEKNITEDEKNKFINTLADKWKVYFQREQLKKQIMTIHRSKGLEFDHVYVDSSSFFYDMRFREQLHYVAITRAKESLTINKSSEYVEELIKRDLLHWIYETIEN